MASYFGTTFGGRCGLLHNVGWLERSGTPASYCRDVHTIAHDFGQTTTMPRARTSGEDGKHASAAVG